MNKTLQQRLQSRISKRRNFIRFMDDALAGTKASRCAIKALDLGFVDNVVDRLTEQINNDRKILRDLANDQKLDKELKNLVTLTNSARRHYGLSDF